jgi:hypothetical protein
MTPPEVVLDRIVRKELKHEDGCSGYSGKLDIDRIEPESLKFFLHLVQSSMNEALRLEGVNASAGVEHPPFHFDYLDVTDGTANAHAFQREDFSFVIVTLPMIELLWHSSHALSGSPLIVNPLRLNPEINLDALQRLSVSDSARLPCRARIHASYPSPLRRERERGDAFLDRVSARRGVG